ncbi:hypothetical protein B9Z55_023782 [Caenorhabditis nigoni]|uniref:Uncharacterized protein n=2 Tax=Caenorhabditis nigoni TaxID=1611254 RepID=A0A2G5SRV7_9PELO|nr:hypothetical protein B9Z55_023782 [Caenorhabditis nigoni]
MSIATHPISEEDSENAAPAGEPSPGTAPAEAIRGLRRRRYSEVSSDITPPSPLSGLSSFDGSPRSLSPVFLPRPESAFDVACVGLWGATDWDTDDVVIDGGHEEQKGKNGQGTSSIGDSNVAKRQLDQKKLLESVAKKLKQEGSASKDNVRQISNGSSGESASQANFTTDSRVSTDGSNGSMGEMPENINEGVTSKNGPPSDPVPLKD